MVLLPTFFVAAAKLAAEPKTNLASVRHSFLVTLAPLTCLCCFNAQRLQVFDEAAQALLYYLINNGASLNGSQADPSAAAGDFCSSHVYAHSVSSDACDISPVITYCRKDNAFSLDHMLRTSAGKCLSCMGCILSDSFGYSVSLVQAARLIPNLASDRQLMVLSVALVVAFQANPDDLGTTSW